MKLENFLKSGSRLAIILKKVQKEKLILELERQGVYKLVYNKFIIERICSIEYPYIFINGVVYKNEPIERLRKLTLGQLEIISNIELIRFNDIDEFKEQENHEKDVFDYMNKSFDSCILDTKLLKMGTFKLENLGGTMYGLKSVTKDMLIVNKEKKYVLLKFNGKEYRVDCHEEDKFNWEIGFGLALSKAFGKQCKWEEIREFYRNKNRKLNYKEYAKWCIIEYFRNDVIEINNLKNKVKEINEYGKVDL